MGFDGGQITIRLNADAGGVARGFNEATGQVKGFKGQMDRIGASLAAAGTKMTMFFTVPAVAMGALSVKAAANYETSMNQIQAASGASGRQMKQLSELAMKMGADTMFSAKDAADAMLELAKGGLKPAAIEAGALTASLDLAAAGGIELGRASEVTVQAMGMFNLKAGEAAQIADIFAAGANASTASVEGLVEALQQVGPGARNAGLSLGDTVGVLAAFADQGIKGSDAGTSLKTMLARLVPETDKQAVAMKALGLSFVDSKGRFDDITTVAQKLHERLGPLSQAQRTQALSTIFGSDATRAATILMKEGAAGIEKYIRATKDRAAAEKMAEARTKGTAGAIERMTGSLETVGIKLGQTLAPYVVDIAKKIERLLNWMSKLPKGWREFIVKAGLAAAAVGPVLIAVGKVAPGISTLVGLWGKVKSATSLADAAAGTLSGTISTMGALAVPSVLVGLGLALKTLQNMTAEAAKFNDQGQKVPGSGANRFGLQDNLDWKIDTTGVGEEIARLLAKLEKLRAKFAEKTAMGDLDGAQKIVAKMDDIQGKVNVLRDRVKQPMAVGHLDAGLWDDAILHATDKAQYFRSMVKRQMAVGHLDNSQWTKPIKTALDKFLNFLSMVKRPMAVGHLDNSGWLSPLDQVAARIAAIRAAAAVPLAVGHGGGGFTGGGGGSGAPTIRPMTYASTNPFAGIPADQINLIPPQFAAAWLGMIDSLQKRYAALLEWAAKIPDDERWKGLGTKEGKWTRFTDFLAKAQDEYQGLLDAAEQIQANIDSLTGTIMGSVALWPQYIEQVNDLGEKVKELQLPTVEMMNPDDLSKVMDANVANMKAWVANMDKLRAAGLPKELLDELTAMGLGGAGQVAGLAAMTAEQLASWTGGWLELQKLAGEQAKATFKDASDAAVAAINDFTAALKAALDALGIPGELAGAAIPGQKSLTVFPQAAGGDYLVTRPTLFLAGEKSAERARFTPLPGGGARSALPSPSGWDGEGGVYVHIGSIVSNDPEAVRVAAREAFIEGMMEFADLKRTNRLGRGR